MSMSDNSAGTITLPPEGAATTVPAGQTATGDGLFVGVEPSRATTQQQQGNPQQPAKVFTEEDIAAARQQEKDKLYGRIDGQQGKLEEIESRLAELAAERDAERQAREEAEAAAAEAARLAEEEGLTVRQLLVKKDEEWQERFNRLEEDRQRAEALLEQEHKFQGVQQYRSNRLQQESQFIVPQLLDYVSGSTEEEIDASIEQAKQRSNAILADIAAAQQQQRVQMPGVSPYGAPPIGPVEEQQAQRQLSPADIRNMTPEQFAANRAALLAASKQQFYS